MTTRVITGVVLAILAVVIVVHGGLVFFLVMLALALLAVNEYFRLTHLYRPLPLAGFLSVSLLLYMAWFRTAHGIVGAVAVAVFLVAGLGLLWGPKRGVTVRMGVTLLGVLYVGIGFAAVLMLRALDGDGLILLTVVFGTWAGDTMAFFTGKYFGTTPMAPVLSPKKTWEGFAGGAISTMLVVVFIGFIYAHLGAGGSLLLGAVIAVAAPIGDLFESLVKRDVQIKDSGRGLPGHGGVLDRFDALLWAAVAAYFVLTLVLGV